MILILRWLRLTMKRPTSGSFLTATGKQLPLSEEGKEWRAAWRGAQNHGFSAQFSHLLKWGKWPNLCRIHSFRFSIFWRSNVVIMVWFSSRRRGCFCNLICNLLLASCYYILETWKLRKWQKWQLVQMTTLPIPIPKWSVNSLTQASDKRSFQVTSISDKTVRRISQKQQAQRRESRTSLRPKAWRWSTVLHGMSPKANFDTRLTHQTCRWVELKKREITQLVYLIVASLRQMKHFSPIAECSSS